MNIYWRIGSYLIAIVAVFGAVNWYGSNKYDEGYDKHKLEAEAADKEASEKARIKELADQKIADEAKEKADDELKKTKAARDRLANLYSSLQHDLAEYERTMSNAANDPAKAIAVGSAGVRNFESCQREYKNMAEEYAERADDHNALIEQCKIGRQ